MKFNFKSKKLHVVSGKYPIKIISRKNKFSAAKQKQIVKQVVNDLGWELSSYRLKEARAEIVINKDCTNKSDKTSLIDQLIISFEKDIQQEAIEYKLRKITDMTGSLEYSGLRNLSISSTKN
ncbi:MAG: hypothetical protein MJZ34_03240 [Paludibacteraceae bacterium]|nr:hypothetical protein [Paludibacteraceae bacterium]